MQDYCQGNMKHLSNVIANIAEYMWDGHKIFGVYATKKSRNKNHLQQGMLLAFSGLISDFLT